jgi:zinc transport system substrate-binding protein
MNRKILWFLLFAGIVVLAGAVLLSRAGVTDTPKEESAALDGKLRIVATFYPLAAFARGVAGDLADVSAIVPAGIEPHDYEPTPQDVLSIRKADMFIINGAGMDNWAKKLRPELERIGKSVVVMEDSMTLLAHDDEEVGGQAPDPHFWLDPLLAKRETETIRDALSLLDPDHAAAYAGNTDAFAKRLDALDQAYRTGLASCTRHDIITSHDAFGYLAKRYGFAAHPIAGLSPEEEPSPKRIAELSDLAKKLDTRYIFTESLVSPKIAETLAREAGARTLVFNPVEGLTPAEAAAGEDYFSIMQANLANLEKALECR